MSNHGSAENSNNSGTASKQSPLQQRFATVIFGTETPAGSAFDILLIIAILASVAVVMLDSIPELHAVYGETYWHIEVVFTLLFTVEYLVRIWCSNNRRAYITSLYGIVDLLSILPTYVALLFPDAGAASLIIIRLLRILRIFRILRLFGLLREFGEILQVLRNSARAIFVFFSMVIILTIIFGCLIYVLEGPESGFTSIPISIYWAIVTITTVGYGDVVPVTTAGRTVSAMGMLIGYSIIAVPTAIVTTKLYERLNRRSNLLEWNCPNCAINGHTRDAIYCKHCGSDLEVPAELREEPETDS
jgi:voltage-gated potassium channel